MMRITAALLILLGIACSLHADPGVETTHLRLSADAALTGIWIDGKPAPLGEHAADWTQADDLGPRAGLRLLAVSAEAGTEMGHAGFIGAVVLKDGRWIVTDSTWRAWPGPGAPPVDAQGRTWTAPDYDDHAWPFATEIGPYGIGPWGDNTQAKPKTVPLSKLDAAMRELGAPPAEKSSGTLDLPPGTTIPAGTNIVALLGLTRHGTPRLWNADWIWAGPPLGGATKAYFRKTFTGGAGVPPGRPQGVQVAAVTPTSFALTWQPSFSAQGPVKYELNWNGQVMLTTAETHGTIDGLTINSTPQNYASVRAVAPDGSRSRPSTYVIIATPSTGTPKKPEHLRVVERGPHGLTVAWDPVPDSGHLESYTVTAGPSLCFVPPGVCSVFLPYDKTQKPGDPIKIRLTVRDTSGKKSPEATLDDWMPPHAPTSLPAPSIRSSAQSPSAPVLYDGGRSGDLLVLRWSRPEAGTCLGYRIEQKKNGAWTALTHIDDPWQDECIVGNPDTFHPNDHDTLPEAGANPAARLEPGTAYRFRVVALGADGKEVASEPLTLSTVAPPAPNPKLRFAVIVATDGHYDHLDHSLADADAAGCAFALIKGQIVPQLSSNPKQWDAMLETVRRHKTPVVFALLASKDGWVELNEEPGPGDAAGEWPVLGRYDMAPWREGQPYDQLHTELGGALRIAGLLETPRSNPAFLPDLEQWLQDAESDPACRWFFTGGVSSESAPQGVPGIMLQLYRPSVDFMRMTNGDRGHELFQAPASAVACACPQRNRVGAHYLVTVEDQRLVLEARQFDARTGTFLTNGLQEIAYDRAANRLAVANDRIPYPFGIATGLTRGLDAGPPWTQNRIVSCSTGGQADVELLGRSPRGAALTFTVTRQPAHGTLTGEGATRVYRPAPGFSGEDFFLYRADDGGPEPGNTAWGRINVSQGH